MNFNNVQKRWKLASFVVGGVILANYSLSRSAQAQVGDYDSIDGDQPNSVEEVQPVPPNVTNDQPNSIEELTPDGDSMSKLRALQEGVLVRLDGTQNVITESTATPGLSSTSPAREPGEAIAVVTPMNNELSLSLMNDTGATVTYEVVGDTARRMLMAGESAMLQDIPLPATITVVRQDEGLLDISAVDTDDGMLQLSLMPEPDLDSTQGVIRIQEDGQVFVN